MNTDYNGQIDFIGIFSAVTMMEMLWQLQHSYNNRRDFYHSVAATLIAKD